jgi:putative flippase GtrA
MFEMQVEISSRRRGFFRTLLRFLAVGSVGLVIDVSVLLLMLRFTDIGPFGARAIGIAAAVAATWMLNHRYTFGRSGQSLAVEGFRYGSVGIVSALVNYAIYSALLVSVPVLRPVVALVLASAAATAFNFFGYSRFVFRR